MRSTPELSGSGQDSGCATSTMGEAEGEAGAQNGYSCLQEIHWSQADEYSHAEEIVGDDEGAVGGEERVESIV